MLNYSAFYIGEDELNRRRVHEVHILGCQLVKTKSSMQVDHRSRFDGWQELQLSPHIPLPRTWGKTAEPPMLGRMRLEVLAKPSRLSQVVTTPSNAQYSYKTSVDANGFQNLFICEINA